MVAATKMLALSDAWGLVAGAGVATGLRAVALASDFRLPRWSPGREGE